MDEKFYRPGVGMMLINAQGLVFVAQRLDQTAEAWQMPQGGIDEDEDPRDALWRELEEEIGTRQAEILGESKDWHYYDLPEHLHKKLWGGKYKGQRQKWFALRFTGRDSDIDITAHDKPEFKEWKWVTPKELPDIIVPFKRDLYEKLIREFQDFL